MSKKTLITKLSNDITAFSAEQIEAYKAFMQASFAPVFSDVSFEIAQTNEEDTLATWMQRINAEFKANDEQSQKPLKGLFGQILEDLFDQRINGKDSDERPRD